MKIGITQRLFLAILMAAALAVISMFLIIQWSIDRGFHRYVDSLEQTRLTRLAGQLEERYAVQGNWTFLQDDPAAWRKLLAASLPDEESGPPGRPRPGGQGGPPAAGEGSSLPPHLRHRFAMRVFLLDAGKQPVIAMPDMPGTAVMRPLNHGGRVVGYLGLLPRQRLSDERQLRFLKEQKFALALVTGVVVLLAAVLSLLLASRLVRPLRGLAAATHELAAGDYSTRVPVVSTDELGQLAGDFNTLALTLAQNEQARRQWVADISHELRTPLAILRGEIEALQDGIRKPSPDSIRSLHGEVLRLGRLVDDLYQLSLSDLGALQYRRERLDLAVLVGDVVSAHRAEFTANNIGLSASLPADGTAQLLGDPERLHQLFANLLANSLKYTAAGGELRIAMTCDGCTVSIDFQDSAPGVTDTDLERLFERLYRVEASRNRATGGAGLGLAICRNIVEAHQGTISARPSPLGGLWVRVELPRAGGSR